MSADRITVVRALPGLGDMLCAVPALRSIRAGAPNAEVTLLGHRRGRWLADRFPELVDEWVDLPWWPTIIECEGTFGDLAGMVAAWPHEPDLFVQLHGSGAAINWLAAPLGSTAALVHVADDTPGPWTTARPWPTHGHEIDRLCDLVELGGFPSAARSLEFPLRSEELARAAELVGERRLAVVHPGVSRSDRRWEASGFGDVAAGLAAAGADVWVTAGPGEESIAAEVVTQAADSRVEPAPALPLGVLGAVLSLACVAVANDTGVAHLSVAVGVPTVVIGTTSDTERWGPRDRVRHRVVHPPDASPAAVMTVLDAAGEISLSGR